MGARALSRPALVMGFIILVMAQGAAKSRRFWCKNSVMCHIIRLTKRWSQPLAVVMTGFDFMKQLFVFATLAPASGGSAWSR